MSILSSSVTWLRHNFGWSTSGSSRWERFVSTLFLLAAAGLIYLSTTSFTFWQTIAAWATFTLLVLIASRLGWVKLFGPVLLYDMIRTARRSRYSIMRIIYGGFLFLVLCQMVLIIYLGAGAPRGVNPREAAKVAEVFFLVFMLVQLAVVTILTPAYVAGAIAEEKDRKTLEFLLATDLRNREIVLSKFLSRLANMTLLVMTGVPILSILQFIGGVDPQLMLAGFASIGLTMLGIGSVSILFSTLFQKPRDAISLTYLVLVAYVALASVALGLSEARHPLTQIPLWFGADPPTTRDVAVALNAGNPLTAIIDVTMAIEGRSRGGGRTTLQAELPGILRRYACFHLLVALVCTAWSIVRVRAIALKQTVGGTTAKLRWWQRIRPPIGYFPMIWKECYIEGRVKVNWLVWLAILVLVALTLGSGLWIVGDYLLEMFKNNPGGRGGWRPRLGESMNIWFRITGTGVAFLLLLMIGVRAATSITHEHERNTMDALLTTPLSAEAILFAKFVGNLTSMRLAWFWIGSMLLLALVTGGLHPLAVPVLVLSWVIYASVFALVGLGFSMLCKSSLQSSVLTMVASLILGGAHWLVTSCCCGPLFGIFMMMLMQRGELMTFFGKVAEYFVKFEAGLTPPVVFVLCSFSWQDFTERRNVMLERNVLELAGFSILGLFLWVTAGVVLWFAVLVPAFRRVTRRGKILHEDAPADAFVDE